MATDLDKLIDLILKEAPFLVRRSLESLEDCKNLFIGAPADHCWSVLVLKTAHELLVQTRVPVINVDHVSTLNPTIYPGDICVLGVDAIVNPVNAQGLGCFIPDHKCVDNLIHRGAGPALRAECVSILKGATLKPSEVFMSNGWALPASYIIHALGPIYASHSPDEASRLLAKTYTASLDLALYNGFKSIAFPSISTGIFGFPKAKARPIVLDAIRPYLPHIQIVLVTWGREDTEGYTRLVGKQ